MKNLLFFTALITVFTLSSCEPAENDNEQIHGKWQAISWEVAGVETLGEDATVVFDFKSDDTYVASSGSSEEAGIYRLETNNLYTTAKGQIEKMVAIKLSSIDTMVMDMNRAGTPELMTLVKAE
jgi:hypothetical protein